MDPSTFRSAIRADTNPDSTNHRGTVRDAWIVRLALMGPVWTKALLDIRLFRTRQAAERRLRRLEAAGRLRFVGHVAIDSGRKVSVWCNRTFGDRMLRHEVDVMRVFFAYWPCAYARTGADVDPKWRPDMELIIGEIETGRTYLVEIDEETESMGQVRRRLAGYGDCPRAVLFIAPTLSRAEEVRRLTENSRIYFTSLDRCLADPWGDHWMNCLGERGRVAKPGVGGVADDVAWGVALHVAHDVANGVAHDVADATSSRAVT